MTPSDIQAYIALYNAFKTVDAYMALSYTPEYAGKYDEVKAYLVEMYGQGITDEMLAKFNNPKIITNPPEPPTQ
jgi:hypothetical protein